MFWRRRRLPILTLDSVAIEEMLREFEDDHFEATGDRLTSAEFYDRYAGGDEVDSRDVVRWASYYELLRAQGQQALSSQESTRLRRAAIA